MSHNHRLQAEGPGRDVTWLSAQEKSLGTRGAEDGSPRCRNKARELQARKSGALTARGSRGRLSQRRERRSRSAALQSSSGWTIPVHAGEGKPLLKLWVQMLILLEAIRDRYASTMFTKYPDIHESPKCITSITTLALNYPLN